MTARHWLKSYGDIPVDINPEGYPSVTAMLDEAMLRYADKVAFNCFGQTLSYAQMDQLSADFCAYLQHLAGIKKGDRVAVMLPNIAAFAVASLGIIRAGAVQVNINPLYTPRELEHQLHDAGCQTIIIFAGATPTLASIMAHAGIKSVLTVGPGDSLGAALPSPPVDARLTQAVPFSVALAQGARLKRLPVQLCGDDLLYLQYTGGTTGPSKGAMLSHRNLLANVAQFKAFMPDATRAGEEVVVTAVPLYHILALMVNFISYFSVGAENWLVANPRDIEGFMAVLKAARPTVFVGVNTMYQALTLHPGMKEVDWSRLRLAAGGGAAVLAVTSERWKALTGTFIREGYGLSETSPILSFNPTFVAHFSSSTGLPMPSTDIKLLDDDGREVAIGLPGEVCARGPQVMRGYWEKPEANAAAFTPDGYFKTGDIGVFDARGFLKIVDRKKDMILVSGFNVYPNEVEAVASAIPGVAECACVGAPDDKSGEAVHLFVVKTADAALAEADVIAQCRLELAPYKVPKVVHLVTTLPKSSVGKILRRDLRKLP